MLTKDKYMYNFKDLFDADKNQTAYGRKKRSQITIKELLENI